MTVTGLLGACNSRQQADADNAKPPIVATNSVNEDGTTVLVVGLTNGITMEVQESQVTLQFQVDNSFTAWFDPRTKRLLKTLIELPANGGEPGQWVRDLNADGVPDLRKIKGGRAEVFYEGEWFPCRPGGGTNTLVDINGRQTSLFYDGVNWREASGGERRVSRREGIH